MAKKKPGGSKNKQGEPSLILRNRKAFHQYEVSEALECGIVLQGTEVKSLRDHNVTFGDSYVLIEGGELFLMSLHIAEYNMGNRENHEPTRKRKLLAKRRQIEKLKTATGAKGMTLVPLKLFWHRGMAKVEVGVVRGKALHDKRQSLKNRELDRDKQRVLRNRDL